MKNEESFPHTASPCAGVLRYSDMITLNFHWAWLVMAALIVLGVVAYVRYYDNGSSLDNGIRMLFGIEALVLCVLLALVIGGIFIW